MVGAKLRKKHLKRFAVADVTIPTPTKNGKILMSKTIYLSGQEIDLASYAIQANALLATRGAGKTHTGKFLAESLMDAGIPVVILDTIGNWKFLSQPSEKIQGKSYPVIVAGNLEDELVDIPLSEDTIEDVLRVALSSRSSLVLDMSGVYLDDEQKDAIVTTVCEILLFENKEYGLRHLFVEESSEFVHQEGRKTDASQAIERLAKLSGNMRVGVTLINQSAETLNKKVLRLCDGMVLGRQKESNSIKRIRKWLGDAGVENASEIATSLPSLPSGTFWLWNSKSDKPVKVQIPEIKSHHPDRNITGEKDFTPSDDRDSVIERMMSIGERSSPPVDDTLSDKLELWEKTVRGNDFGFLDNLKISRAKMTRYGSVTVFDYVNSLIVKGFLLSESLWSIMTKESTGERIFLNSGVEVDYAKIASRVWRNL